MEGLWQNTLENTGEKVILREDSTEELFRNLEGIGVGNLQEMNDSEQKLNDLEGSEKESALLEIRDSLSTLHATIVWNHSQWEDSREGLAGIRVINNPETEISIETEYKTDTQALKTELEQTGFNSLLVSELMENLNESMPEAGDSYSVEQMREELEAQGVAQAELEELMKNITHSA